MLVTIIENQTDITYMKFRQRSFLANVMPKVLGIYLISKELLGLNQTKSKNILKLKAYWQYTLSIPLDQLLGLILNA